MFLLLNKLLQLDLGNLVTDDAGNMYMKDNETGQYVPVSATEQGGQVVIQPSENFTQEPQVMQEEQDQLVAQIVDAGEPAPGGTFNSILKLYLNYYCSYFMIIIQ